MQKLIKRIEASFPPGRYQWIVTRNHDGRYFANIMPCALHDVAKGPDNHARHATSAQTALRLAYENAKRNGVGPRLYKGTDHVE